MEIMKKFAAAAAAPYDTPGITLAFLGDSVTQGCFELAERADEGFRNCHDRSSVYHTRLSQILGVLYPAVTVNIINAGAAGKNAAHGLARLERDVLRHNPDLTVVCFGLNDCGEGAEGLPRYIQSLDAIFRQLAEHGSEIIFMTPNMMATQVSPLLTAPLFRNLAQTISARQNAGILDSYLDAARELCRSRGIPVCDCYQKWKQLAACGVDTTELLSNKLNHPTRPMHWLFATSLMETMLG